MNAFMETLDPASRRQLEWQQRIFNSVPKVMQTELPPATSESEAAKAGNDADAKSPAKKSPFAKAVKKQEKPAASAGYESFLSNNFLGVSEAAAKAKQAKEAAAKLREVAARIERAAQGEVLVAGASWMLFGASFAGEHQRMLAQLQTSDTTHGRSDSEEKHAHISALTRLSWLQPESGATALTLLLGSRPAAKALKKFVTRACPRLLPSLDELMKRVRGAKEEIKIVEKGRAPPATQKAAAAADTAPHLVNHGTLDEMLDKELLLAWAEFLASDECASLMYALLPLTKSSSSKINPIQGLHLLPPVKKGETWVTKFTQATKKLGCAVMLVDVREAGLPLVYVNDAFERLTGYPQAEALGRNCRFLQGEGTEAASVAELVRSIREAQPCVVKITNYRKKGAAFVNELSLHPVCDSRGVYRYVIGVAADASEIEAPGDRAMLVALRHRLPEHYPASLNSPQERRVRSFDVLNSEYQYEGAVVQLARVACCNDMRCSLEKLLQHPKTASAIESALPVNESRFR